MAKSPKSNKATPAEPDEAQAKGFSPHLWVRNRYITKHRNMVFGQGRFLEYRAGVFSEVPQYKVRREIAEIGEKVTGFEVTSHAVSSVTDLIRDARSEDDARFDSRHDVLLFRDCVLDLNTFEPSPHSPEYRATSKLPFDYKPDATSDAWAKWGERIDEKVRLYLEEFGGLCLTTDQRFEKSVWLVGKPNCGKGTYIQALQSALGPTRWTTLSSTDISNRFGLVNLAGKTLAISAESAPIKTAHCIDVVNRIISGEPIRVEQKGQPSYDLTPRCKLLCAMNIKPSVSNPDSGIFRRTDIVPMPPLVGAIDPRVKEAIIANGQAVVNVFLAGLKRLRQRGHFDVPKLVQIASDEFRADNDHVALFLEDCFISDPDNREKASSVNTAYFDWCKANGFRDPLDSKKLKAELERLGAVYLRSNGSWFQGIKPN